CARRAFDFW
nr:immunoglobulin heavy chain junction region [Homo sapiens]